MTPPPQQLDIFAHSRDVTLRNAALEAIERRAAAAARQAFSAPAGAVWMRTAWAALAARCEHLTFDPAHADDHAGALLLRAAQWQAAATAVQRIESWRRKRRSAAAAATRWPGSRPGC